jgi:hypothetical protein
VVKTLEEFSPQRRGRKKKKLRFFTTENTEEEKIKILSSLCDLCVLCGKIFPLSSSLLSLFSVVKILLDLAE